MDDNIEIRPTRWSRIKLVIAGLCMVPGCGFIAWMDVFPDFVRLSGGIGFLTMLIATPILIAQIFMNRPSYAIGKQGIEIKDIFKARFIPWSDINDIKFLDFAPFDRPIGSSDGWGDLQVELLLKNSTFWNRGPTLSVGEANVSPSDIVKIITAYFNNSRTSEA